MMQNKLSGLILTIFFFSFSNLSFGEDFELTGENVGFQPHNDIGSIIETHINMAQLCGQLTWPGDWIIKNRNDTKNINCYRVIKGSLIIENSDLRDVKILTSLFAVEGNLEIKNNAYLENLEGLGTLQRVGGNLTILKNTNLTNLKNLNSLTTIGKDLRIQENPLITTLAGLDSLTVIGGSFIIKSNIALRSFVYFGNSNDPSTKAGLFYLSSLGRSILVEDNRSLWDLNGLMKIQNVINGDVKIRFNNTLKDFNGLNYIKEIKGNLLIEGNQSLTSMSQLYNLERIRGHLQIIGNNVLKDLHGLDKLEVINDWYIVRSNATLETLAGTIKLNEIGEGIYIDGNPKLQYVSDAFEGGIRQDEFTTFKGKEIYITNNISLKKNYGGSGHIMMEGNQCAHLFAILVFHRRYFSDRDWDGKYVCEVNGMQW